MENKINIQIHTYTSPQPIIIDNSFKQLEKSLYEFNSNQILLISKIIKT